MNLCLQVFLTLRRIGKLPVACPMWEDTTIYKDGNCYCEYHKDTMHATGKCLNLAKVLRKLRPTSDAPPPIARRTTVILTGHNVSKKNPASRKS